jgi:cytoskeletal protein CcmA (bactofilin family)/DNA-directed RNA polymerase subunit RPC12/RpoP
MKPQQVAVTCPACGHTQLEPALAYSTVCKQCRAHFRVQDVLRPAARPPPPLRDVKRVACFKCAAGLEVPAAAQSTMCKHCGSHVDLRDYQITSAVSKNFKTKGRFVIEAGGYLFNSETIAGEVVLKGRFLGRLVAEQSLEVHSSAELKGRFQAEKLIVPAGQRFRWPEPIALGSAEILGEVAASLHAAATVALKSTARFFGDIVAGGLVVEEGAVLVGSMTIGRNNTPTSPPNP